MVRYDLAFFLCCCKSFLGSTESPDGESFYDLLGVERDASQDDIKRAYKRRSLQMHPDKLAQRGQQVTDADQARFTRMKEAYEVLSDPHKRESYDAIGEKGMKWLEEPFSLDPQELAHNFATSSLLDRSKIFAIFILIAIAIFILPILVCLQVDSQFGPGSSWLAVLTPLWLWDAFILFYHSRVIMMGPIHRPDHIPEEEWVDPLPMGKRIFSLCRFCLIVLFEILAALKLDGVGVFGQWSWSEIFFPIYVWEATTLWKKLPLARMRIVTVEDLETALGKPFAEFSQAEKELIAKRYSVVPSTSSPEFEAAHKLKSRARQDVIKLVFRAVFLVFLIVQLDTDLDWNWWLVFLPFWVMSFCICCGNCHSFMEVQTMAAERDPEFFGGKMPGTSESGEGNGDDEENQNLNSSSNYGVMYDDKKTEEGAKTEEKKSITEEEREELKAQVMQSGYRMISTCVSQAFILLIVCLFVGKIQGADYASIWIISPLLIVAGIILCFLGCTIFCITEVPEDAMEYDSANPASQPPTATNAPSPNTSSTTYIPPAVPTTAATTSTSATTKKDSTTTSTSKNQPPKATWDPERGEVWNEPTDNDGDDNQPLNESSSSSAAAAPAPATSAVPAPATAPIDLLDNILITTKNTKLIILLSHFMTPIPLPTCCCCCCKMCMIFSNEIMGYDGVQP